MVQAETDADEILDPAAALAALRDCSVVIGMVSPARTRAGTHALALARARARTHARMHARAHTR